MSNTFFEVAEECDQLDKRGKRHYCGTKNNYTDDDIIALEKWAQDKCTYLVYGIEKGVKGTPHLQIYMEFENTISMKSITKKLFPMWLGFRKGTPREAAGYCKKGKDTPPLGLGYDYFFPRTVEEPESWKGNEFGEISRQGKRTDVDEVVEMIVHEKKRIRETALEHPSQFIKYHKGITALRSMVLEPRNLSEPPNVIVHFGPTGTGKTLDAHTIFQGKLFYKWEPDNGHWWDRYDGEEYIIIDEFRAQIAFGSLLTLLDRYGCRRPFKGGFVEIQAHTFIITSPVHPREWYNSENLKGSESLVQLKRRITKIVEYPLKVSVSW